MSSARSRLVATSLAVAVALASGCESTRGPVPPAPPPAAREIEVEATAFNDTPEQTQGDPQDTATGKRLTPGMRVIAVSDDLYAQGFRDGVRVRIEGLPGTWEVADRMPSKWRRRIDIYMGSDERAARAWGLRRVKISRP